MDISAHFGQCGASQYSRPRSSKKSPLEVLAARREYSLMSKAEKGEVVMKFSTILVLTALIFLNACATYAHLRSHPPACKSYNYAGFMGQSRDWVVAQAIPER